MVIEPTAAAVRTSRRLVTDVLVGDDVLLGDDGELADVVDRALLCASELVTNAIEHAEAPAGIRVTVDDETVRIEVQDSSERPPLVRAPDATSVRGRGMLIVDRCSDRWGIDRRPGGKTVWCELARLGGQRPLGPMASAPPR